MTGEDTLTSANEEKISLEKKKLPSRVALSTHQGLRVVRESMEWYRDRYRQMTRILVGLSLSNVLLIILTAILFFSQKEPRYYAITPDLRIQEMVALEEPFIPNAGLNNWVAQTVTSTLSLNFRNWKNQLGQVRAAYDPKAFESLVVAMKNNGILDLIEEKGLICSAVVQDAPIIYASGKQEGRYMWRLKMPVAMSYESSRGIEYRQNLMAEILVQRVSTLEYPIGINIRQIILTTGK